MKNVIFEDLTETNIDSTKVFFRESYDKEGFYINTDEFGFVTILHVKGSLVYSLGLNIDDNNEKFNICNAKIIDNDAELELSENKVNNSGYVSESFVLDLIKALK